MKKATVLKLIDKDNKILLLQRRLDDRRSPGWCLPGGKIDPDDNSILQALHREVYEETGIIIDVFEVSYEQQYISVIEGKENIRVYVYTLELPIPSTAIKIVLSDEHINYAWYDEEQLEGMKESLAGNTELALKPS